MPPGSVRQEPPDNIEVAYSKENVLFPLLMATGCRLYKNDWSIGNSD
jgi:hypothetical protein